jgi:hypothetical protein
MVRRQHATTYLSRAPNGDKAYKAKEILIIERNRRRIVDKQICNLLSPSRKRLTARPYG